MSGKDQEKGEAKNEDSPKKINNFLNLNQIAGKRKSTRRQRPQTARSVPRYMQQIHDKVLKDASFKIKQFYYRDVAIIRYYHNESAQVVNETQFI